MDRRAFIGAATAASAIALGLRTNPAAASNARFFGTVNVTEASADINPSTLARLMDVGGSYTLIDSVTGALVQGGVRAEDVAWSSPLATIKDALIAAIRQDVAATHGLDLGTRPDLLFVGFVPWPFA